MSEVQEVLTKGVKYMFPWASDEHISGAVKIAEGMSTCVNYDLPTTASSQHVPSWGAPETGKHAHVSELAKKFVSQYCG